MIYLYNIFEKRNIELIKRLKQDIPISVSNALKEDLNNHIDTESDITSLLIPNHVKINAYIFTREDGVFCGKKWVEEVFNQLGGNVTIKWQVKDGDNIKTNQLICLLHGPARILAIGERTVLNFTQTLCGVASTVKRYADLLAHTDTLLLDTRKTLPGLRTAQKYAVLCGGGHIHRLGLADAFLIKENHIIAAGSITKAVEKAAVIRINAPIGIEVENLDELKQALEADVSIIMLDNFSVEDTFKAVHITQKRVALEVSGNISLENLHNYAETGVNYISIGALTKHLHAIDLSMRFIGN